MTETIINLTNPDQTPVVGDLITRIGANYSVTEEYQGSREPQDPTASEIAQAARVWRDMELIATDTASQTPDWPNRDNIITYRAALRNWPSTSDFPDTKPVLGS